MAEPIIEFEAKSKLKDRILIILVVFNLIFMAIISYLVITINQESKQTNENTSTIKNEQVNLSINQENITDNIDKALRAVVSINNLKQGQKIGSGSGVTYKQDGTYSYIMTNNHVIQNGDSYEIKLNNGDTLNAELIGSDPITDLAILKVKHLIDPIEIGSSDSINLGEPVYALGSPMGLNGTVTNGIISTKTRTIPVDLNQDGIADYEIDVIQTDAAINPGNSGGALINTRGQLIGINSQKIAATEIDNIGFAIPIDSAMKIIEQLEKNGKVIRPSLGIKIIDLARLSSFDIKNIKKPKDMKELYGVYIYEVNKGSSAESSGIKKDDIIIGINDEEIQNSSQLRRILYTLSIGEKVDIKLLRQGEIMNIKVTLE